MSEFPREILYSRRRRLIEETIMTQEDTTLPLMEGEDIVTFLLDLEARMLLNSHI